MEKINNYKNRRCDCQISCMLVNDDVQWSVQPAAFTISVNRIYKFVLKRRFFQVINETYSHFPQN